MKAFILVLSFVSFGSSAPSSIAVVPVPYEDRNLCVLAGDTWVEVQTKEWHNNLATYACLPAEVKE